VLHARGYAIALRWTRAFAGAKVVAMATILLIYSSTDGQTLRICQHLQHIIEDCGHKTTLAPVEQAAQHDLSAFDKIALGASIRYGKHSPLVRDFVQRHAALLDSKPNAFFSVNLVARKPEKSQPATNPYLLKFLRQIEWQPKHLAVFAGKINYPVYSPLDRLVIRLIMWMTHGPTQPDAVIEFTDWAQVESFGQVIADM
jgi:menaquinone-dependent protoporphyrinogen oxidase